MGTAAIAFCCSSLTLQLTEVFSLRQQSRRSCQVKMLQRPRRQLWQLSNHYHKLQSITIGNIIWLHQLSVLFSVLFLNFFFRVLNNNLFLFFLFQMSSSAKIIRTTHLPQFKGAYFGLKNQYKILLNIVRNFFLQFMMPIKHIKNFNDCIIFCYKKKS